MGVLARGVLSWLLALDEAGAGLANAAAHGRPTARRLIAAAAGWVAASEVLFMVGLGVSGRRRAAMRMLLAVSTVYVAVEGLALTWRRQRPFARLDAVRAVVPHAAERSFPSRHVASAVAMARIGGRARPRVGRWMAVLAGLLAVGRVGAGLHYPSDVVAGAALGLAIGGVFREWP
jgi:undecaprenyl-diphosphatase